MTERGLSDSALGSGDMGFPMVPDMGHDTLALLKGLGEANWEFYRAAFGKESKTDGAPKPEAK